jgi:hypothetical protein
MAYPDKYGLTLEPTKTKLELAVLELDWHIALLRGTERDVLRIRAELEAQGLRYNEETRKWKETNVFDGFWTPFPPESRFRFWRRPIRR